MMTMLLLFFGTMALSLYASWKVRSAYNRYSQVPASSGYTGAEVAQRILDLNGIRDVSIHSTHGHLTDHYDPSNRRLVLSEENYHGTSVAALGIAAHECGHAIQHQQLYAPLKWRMAAVGITGIASQIVMWVPLIGLFGGFFPYKLAITIMAVSFGILMLFQLVTLPVEFDATARAKKVLAGTGAVAAGTEFKAMSKVLDAAALTYVAAFVSTLGYFLYYLLQMTGMRGNDE
ncbi:zinc metallopeptidase [Prosthecobacter sp. SYSU 5D2]|uniref:zinc metallopeptidase n=1 Tax=Prosthecobacter sp. SYSU 5D2 TaxID=3134134 RepID=UPI0031FE75EC